MQEFQSGAVANSTSISLAQVLNVFYVCIRYSSQHGRELRIKQEDKQVRIQSPSPPGVYIPVQGSAHCSWMFSVSKNNTTGTEPRSFGCAVYSSFCATNGP